MNRSVKQLKQPQKIQQAQDKAQVTTNGILSFQHSWQYHQNNTNVYFERSDPKTHKKRHSDHIRAPSGTRNKTPKFSSIFVAALETQPMETIAKPKPKSATSFILYGHQKSSSNLTNHCKVANINNLTQPYHICPKKE
ncbi:hypothetical protein GQX74_010198 [Glossina fuscipes]|nr:hypothetical protein GQX74_010198 [Glossina fuscipes]